MPEQTSHTPAPLARFGLSYDARDRLVLIDADGRRHVDVEPIRAFPISDPAHWVTICDAEGRELVCLENLDELPVAVREVLDQELLRRDFIPVILRINSVSTHVDPCEWNVETDRGPTRFVVGGEDDVRRLGPHRALVVDASGIRYLIPDSRTLDHHSNRILERYL
jgi:hypothetical protein